MELTRLGLVGKVISLYNGRKQLLFFQDFADSWRGCKTLFDPQISTSFEWGAREVGYAAGRGAVYILAEEELIIKGPLPIEIENKVSECELAIQ